MKKSNKKLMTKFIAIGIIISMMLPIVLSTIAYFI